MKKITFLIGIVALIITGLGIYSCQKGEINKNSFESKLDALEKNITLSSTNLNITKDKIEKDLDKNKLFIEELKKEIQVVRQEIENTITSKKTTKKINIPNKIKVKYGEEAMLVIKSLEKLRNNHPLEKQYELFEMYEQFIDNTLYNSSDYENLKNTIVVLKWMNYEYVIKYNNISTTSKSLAMGYEARWQPCGHRDCFDCCMYRKLKEDRNIVEFTAVLISLPQSMAWFTGSCLYDCTRIYYEI